MSHPQTRTPAFRLLPRIIGFLCLFMACGGSGEASSFPFRNVSIGDAAPPLTLTDAGTNAPAAISPQGKPVVLLFWGADLETKKERAIEALKDLEQLGPFFTEHGIRMLSVNAQGDDGAVIVQVTKNAHSTFPALMDLGQKAYADLGIFVMPSVLVLDGQNKVAAGMGYSHDMTSRLQGELEILLGKKTRKQAEAELRPEIIEKSKEEKVAHRHYEMGMVMLDQSMPERAIEEFQAAITKAPQLAEAHIQLACTYLDLNQIDQAEQAIGKGLELDPNALDGQICDARLSAARGDLDGAIADLEALLFRNGREHGLHFALAALYEKNGNMPKAAESFRKAYEFLLRTMPKQ